MNKNYLNAIRRGILVGCLLWFSAYMFFNGDIPFYAVLGSICGLLGILVGIVKRTHFHDERKGENAKR